MNNSALRRVGEAGRAALLAFTAISFATVQFLQHSLPSPDIVWVSSEVVLLALTVWVLVPTLVLTVVDRLIAGLRGERPLTIYRSVLLAVAGVLVLRQFQLYFGPVNAVLDPLGPLAVAVHIVVAAAMARTCLKHPAKTYQSTLYLAPVAILLVLFTPVQMAPTLGNPPAGHAAEVPSIDSDRDPVFVFVMDELSYEMLQQDGDIDSSRYPNIAALKEESLSLTNATTNYLHTSFIVPRFIEAVARLSAEYDVRVYDQYAYVEASGWDDCGVVYTCRGAANFGATRKLELTGILSRRAAFQAAPAAFDPVVGRLLSWVDGDLDAPSPAVDHLGMHTFTNLQFETFMSDVDSGSAHGRLHFVHVLLPHAPYIFERGGAVADDDLDTSFELSDDIASIDERYRQQTEYLDELVGRFVQKLRDEGLYESSTIILTGDHGIRRNMVNDNDAITEEGVPIDDDTTRVPFLVKAPRLAPAESGVDYQHIDFEATLRDLLGVSPNGSVGVSAFAGERPERSKVLYVDQKNARYWKYVRDNSSGDWKLEEYVVGPIPEPQEAFASVVD